MKEDTHNTHRTRGALTTFVSRRGRAEEAYVRKETEESESAQHVSFIQKTYDTVYCAIH